MTTHVIRAQVAPDFMLCVTSPVVSHFPPLALTTSTLLQLRANTAFRDPGYLAVSLDFRINSTSQSKNLGMM